MLKKNTNKLILIAIILIGLFLRFYKLRDLAPFVGDQGRDYLAARDILVNKKLTFKGPQTSIPWIYLGPFFYYFLAFFLSIGKFDPLFPIYGTSIFGVFSIILIFVIVKNMFSERTGLIAAFFYAISPYSILQSRISLHPSIFPFFEILFFIFLYDFFQKRKIIYLILLFLNFLIIIQLHLSAVLLIPITLLIYEKFKKQNSNTLFKLFLMLAISLLFLKILKNSPMTSLKYWWKIFSEIFSYGNFFGAIFALFLTIKGICYLVKINNFQTKILKICLVVIITGLTVKNSQAEHYFNLFLPIIIIVFSLGIEEILRRRFKRIFFLICSFFLIINSFYLIRTNYYSYIYGPPLKQRINLAKFIVEDSKNNNIILKRCGYLWDYPSTNKNYEYLVWWLSKGEKKVNRYIVYYILEPAGNFEGCNQIKGEIFDFNYAWVLKPETKI